MRAAHRCLTSQISEVTNSNTQYCHFFLDVSFVQQYIIPQALEIYAVKTKIAAAVALTLTDLTDKLYLCKLSS